MKSTVTRIARLMQRLQGAQSLRIAFDNTVWQISSKVLRMIVNLLTGIWVARYLEPGNFGLLNFAIAFVALFSPISDFGIQAVLVRDLVRSPERRGPLLSSALAIRVVGAAAAILLAPATLYVARGGDSLSRGVVLAVAISLLPQAWDVIEFDYQARMRALPIAIVRTISLVTFALARVILILGQFGVIAFALMIAGEACLSAFIMRLLFKSQIPAFGVFFSRWADVKYLLRNCWPLAISSLSVLLYMRIDQVMLGQMLGNHAVGILSAAVRISESWLFVPMAFLAAVSPLLTAELRRSDARFTQKLVLVTRLMFVVSLIFAAVLTFYSQSLINMLYGKQYAEAGAVLKVHAWAGVFASLGLASDPWFVNRGLLKFRMFHTVVGTIVNVVLNFFLIPRYGVYGSAIATLISYSVAGLWLNALSSRTLPVFRIQTRACLGFG